MAKQKKKKLGKCPKCNKGELVATGLSYFGSPDSHEYKCDKCDFVTTKMDQSAIDRLTERVKNRF